MTQRPSLSLAENYADGGGAPSGGYTVLFVHRDNALTDTQTQVKHYNTYKRLGKERDLLNKI